MGVVGAITMATVSDTAVGNQSVTMALDLLLKIFRVSGSCDTLWVECLLISIECLSISIVGMTISIWSIKMAYDRIEISVFAVLVLLINLTDQQTKVTNELLHH